MLSPATTTGRYSPVADRVQLINNPAHALDAFDATDYEAGRLAVDVEDGPDWAEDYPLTATSELRVVPAADGPMPPGR